MKTYQDYINYWENIAKQHEDIKHDPNDANNKKFFRINIEETITGFRQEIAEKEIVMVLVNYAFDNDSVNPSNVMSTVKFGFMIIGHADAGDDDAQALLMTKTEDIVKQIIARANLESKQEVLDGTDFWFNSLNEDVNFYSTPVNYIGDGNYHGWLVTGEFKQSFDCRVDVSQWADLEVGDMGIIDIPPFIDCAPAIVKNSDGSYEVSVPSGDTLVLADASATDSDGTVYPLPYGQDFVATPQDDTIYAEFTFIGTIEVFQTVFSVNGVTTYTTEITRANIGTLTISTDDVTYDPFTYPFTPTAGVVYYFKRSDKTVTGTLIFSD